MWSRKLGINGEDRQGVDYGVEFLKQAGDKDNQPRVGEHVVVIAAAMWPSTWQERPCGSALSR